MAKGDTTKNEYMLFLFNGTAMPSYGATYQVRLHTADPGAAGTGATNEATYTSYTPVNITRGSGAGGFTVSADTATNTSEITFPECTGGTEVITHASVCTGSGQILHKAALNASISVSNLITPRVPAGTLVLREG